MTRRLGAEPQSGCRIAKGLRTTRKKAPNECMIGNGAVEVFGSLAGFEPQKTELCLISGSIGTRTARRLRNELWSVCQAVVTDGDEGAGAADPFDRHMAGNVVTRVESGVCGVKTVRRQSSASTQGQRIQQEGQCMYRHWYHVIKV